MYLELKVFIELLLSLNTNHATGVLPVAFTNQSLAGAIPIPTPLGGRGAAPQTPFCCFFALWLAGHSVKISASHPLSQTVSPLTSGEAD